MIVRRRVPNEVLLPEVERMLSEGLTVTLRTKGSSMLPFIVGDRDSVVLQNPRDLKVGDIVLARVGEGRYYLHRIIALKDDKVRLMGDGNVKGTEVCRLSEVCGKVKVIVRNGKEVNPEGRGERCRAWWWRKLLPFRRILLGVYRRIR